jgi:rfaE bifunctional protein kinase chain/domain
MNGNTNSKSESFPEGAKPKADQSNEEVGQGETPLSSSEIFAQNKPGSHGDAQPDPSAKGFIRSSLGDSLGFSGRDLTNSDRTRLLTKELSRELSSSGRDSTSPATNYKTTFLPASRFINAQGLQQMPFLQMRKSEFKHEEVDQEKLKAQKLSKDLAMNVPPPPLVETDKKPNDKQPLKRDSKLSEQEQAIVKELEADNIYQVSKEFLKKPEEPESFDDEAPFEPRIFKTLEKIRPHDTLMPVAPTLAKDRLKECIQKLKDGRVIVVGDLLIDELLEGKPERISREAPVLILEHVDTELIPGGAANTAHNITALGASCHAVGVCGMDENAERMARTLERHGINHSLVNDPSRPTTVKTRILSKSHSFKQQLLRLDRISHEPIDEAIEILLVAKLAPLMKSYDAIVLSDYRAGVMTDGIIIACRRIAEENNLFLVVDAQDNFGRFQNVDLITPNQPDAQAAVGFEFDSDKQLIQGGKALLLLTGAKSILVTRGAQGMALFREGKPPLSMPVFNKSEVFDVTGAGDTVVAVMTLAMVTGSTQEEAMALGNLAAGIVVRKPGTAVTSLEEMIANLEKVSL